MMFKGIGRVYRVIGTVLFIGLGSPAFAGAKVGEMDTDINCACVSDAVQPPERSAEAAAPTSEAKSPTLNSKDTQ